MRGSLGDRGREGRSEGEEGDGWDKGKGIKREQTEKLNLQTAASEKHTTASRL